MSTPNQGPETAARPGLSEEALKALGPMTPAQQQAMNHVVNAVKAVAPMINAVAKCIRGIRNTFARISQAAQRLTSTDRALNQSQGGRHRAESSPRLSMPTREQVAQARDRGRSLARDAGRALVNGTGKALATAGRWAWSKMQEGKAAAGEQVAKQVARGQVWANEKVMPLVQAADNKLSQAADWTGGKVDQAVAYGNQQMSRAAARASAALAAFAERRNDPTNNVPGQQLPKADLAFIQHVTAIVSSQNTDSAKMAELGRLVEPLRAQAAGAPAVEAGAQSVAASQHAAWVLGPNADANSIRPPAATGQATPSAAESAPGLHTKKQGPDPTQSRD